MILVDGDFTQGQCVMHFSKGQVWVLRDTMQQFRKEEDLCAYLGKLPILELKGKDRFYYPF